jgi:hypothetical protein
MKVTLVIGIVMLILIFAPFALVWSLNTLFNLSIAYTFKTWLASFVLAATVGGTKVSKK